MPTWYSDIADLRTKHNLVVLMQDNASEYKSEEMMQFLESKGIHSHFSIPKKLWQNGAAESTINSRMMSARTVMTESGLGGRFWFKAGRSGATTSRCGWTLSSSSPRPPFFEGTRADIVKAYVVPGLK